MSSLVNSEKINALLALSSITTSCFHPETHQTKSETCSEYHFVKSFSVFILEQQLEQRRGEPEGRVGCHDRGGQIKDAPGTFSLRAPRSQVPHLSGSFPFQTLNLMFLCCLQYKVRAYIQMKSSKACKREIKSVMNTAGNVSPNFIHFLFICHLLFYH